MIYTWNLVHKLHEISNDELIADKTDHCLCFVVLLGNGGTLWESKDK